MYDNQDADISEPEEMNITSRRVQCLLSSFMLAFSASVYVEFLFPYWLQQPLSYSLAPGKVARVRTRAHDR